MKLDRLVRDALALRLSLPDTEVERVVQDTRTLEPGVPSVFVARRGSGFDGHRFAPRAIAQGAVAIVGSAPLEEREGFPWYYAVPYIYVSDDRAALAALAAALYGQPSQRLFTLGVTGTDGKTTTSYLLEHLLASEYPTGLISTAGVRIRGDELTLPGHFTTPEAPEIQGLLARCLEAGCTHAIIESSSHGFAQRRLDSVDYDVGVWTNLTPEHLDFHGTFEGYREAKGELMNRARVSVLNLDDPEYGYFSGRAARVVSYGLSEGADWRADEVQEEAGRLSWLLELRGARFAATLSMIGSYNVLNALAALAAASEAGVSIGILLRRLATFPGVPGRMQVVQREPFAVVVDFAHTPPALTKALQAVRPQVEGRLIVVVGAAGERDPGKRQPLGESAVQHADFAIFTEEDSRSEDGGGILEQLSAGARAAGGVDGRDFSLVPERRAAIRRAVELAEPGDLVLLAGKGHERTLERAQETLTWDEVAEAKAALSFAR